MGGRVGNVESKPASTNHQLASRAFVWRGQAEGICPTAGGCR